MNFSTYYFSKFTKTDKWPTEFHKDSKFNEPIKMDPTSAAPHGRSRRAGDIDDAGREWVARKIVDTVFETGGNLSEAAIALAFVWIEAGFNPDAAPAGSSACGVGQFVKDTWIFYKMNLVNPRDQPFVNGTESMKNVDPFDAEKNIRYMVEFMYWLFNRLRKEGIPVNSDVDLCRWAYALHYRGQNFKNIITLENTKYMTAALTLVPKLPEFKEAIKAYHNVIRYPFAKDVLPASPLAYYHNNETGKGGFFPLGSTQNIHGGIHLHPEKNDTPTALHSMAPGYIIAARLIGPDTTIDGEKVADNVLQKLNNNYYGLLLVRHEFYEPVNSSSSSQSSTPPAKHPIYSLYMHLAPPDWKNPQKDTYADIDWLNKIRQTQNGSVICLDPDNPDFATQFWLATTFDTETFNAETADPAAIIENTIYKDDDTEQKIALKKGNKKLVYFKRTPEDIKEAYTALKEGKLVTFNAPFLTVTGGEKIGYVKKTPQSDACSPSGFLHWELFSKPDPNSGLSKLLSIASSAINMEFPNLSKETEDNFIDLQELKDLLSPLLSQQGQEKLTDILATKDYQAKLFKLFFSPDDFLGADASKQDDASTIGDFTYPIKLEIGNDLHLPEPPHGKPYIINIEYYKKEVLLKSGSISYTSLADLPNKELQVPADTDSIVLSSNDFHIAENTLQNIDDECSLFKNCITTRWRNAKVTYLGEWAPARIEKLITKLTDKEHLKPIVSFIKAASLATPVGLPVQAISAANSASDGEIFDFLKRQTKKFLGWYQGDPAWEKAVLGKAGAEQRIFSNDGMLPPDGKVDCMNPITAHWLLQLLHSRKKIVLNDTFKIFEMDDSMMPEFWSFCFSGNRPTSSSAISAIVVTKGFQTFTSKKITLILTKSTDSNFSKEFNNLSFVNGVSKLQTPGNLWDKWRLKMKNDNNTIAAPADAVVEITFKKPTLVTDTPVRVLPPENSKIKNYSQLIFFENNAPDSFDGFICFGYAVTNKGELPTDTTPLTNSTCLIPVSVAGLAGKGIMDEVYIEANKEQTENPVITPGFNLKELKGKKISRFLLANLGLLRQLTNFALSPTVDDGGKSVKITLGKVNTEANLINLHSLGTKNLHGVQLKFVDSSNKILQSAKGAKGLRLSITDDMLYSSALYKVPFNPELILGKIVTEANSPANKDIHIKAGFICPEMGTAQYEGTLENGVFQPTKAIPSQHSIKAMAKGFLMKTSVPGLGDIAYSMKGTELCCEVECCGGTLNEWKKAKPIFYINGVKAKTTSPREVFRPTGVNGKSVKLLAVSSAVDLTPYNQSNDPVRNNLTIEARTEVSPATFNGVSITIEPRSYQFEPQLWVGELTAVLTQDGKKVIISIPTRAFPTNKDMKLSCISADTKKDLSGLIEYCNPVSGQKLGTVGPDGLFKAILLTKNLKWCTTYEFKWERTRESLVYGFPKTKYTKECTFKYGNENPLNLRLTK